MTAVAGIVHDNVVFIGADSAGTSGWSLSVRSDQKVFKREGFAFGFTTSFRMGQLLRYRLDIPGVPLEDDDLEKYMATTFIDAVRSCLTDGGWATKNNEHEEGGTFLVGVKGRLFVVYDDYQVAESASGYAAVGSGQDLALGALYATRDLAMHSSQRIGIALAAAEYHSAPVRHPFTIVQLGGDVA